MMLLYPPLGASQLGLYHFRLALLQQFLLASIDGMTAVVACKPRNNCQLAVRGGLFFFFLFFLYNESLHATTVDMLRRLLCHHRSQA